MKRGITVVGLAALVLVGCADSDRAPAPSYNPISTWIDPAVAGARSAGAVPPEVLAALESAGRSDCVVGGKPAIEGSSYRIYCDSYFRAYLISGDIVSGAEIGSVETSSVDPPLVDLTLTEAGRKSFAASKISVGAVVAVIKDGWVCATPKYEAGDGGRVTFAGGAAISACLLR